jgi:hypothetical protein
VSAGFAFAVGALLCAREGLADATCVLSVLAPAGFGFVAAGFCFDAAPLFAAMVGVLLSIDDVGVLAVADALLSIDVAGLLAAADALLSVDAAGVLALFDASAFPASLVLRQSLNAAPLRPVHGAYDVEEAGGGGVAVLSGVLPVVWAPTAPAAANAVARSRTRGLNEDWFMQPPTESGDSRSCALFGLYPNNDS